MGGGGVGEEGEKEGEGEIAEKVLCLNMHHM